VCGNIAQFTVFITKLQEIESTIGEGYRPRLAKIGDIV